MTPSPFHRTLHLDLVDIHSVPAECWTLTNSEFEGSQMRRTLEGEVAGESKFGKLSATKAVIARIDGVVVGWATWWIIKPMPGTGMEPRALVGVFVAETWRRQGIGEELVRFATATTAAEGAVLIADPWNAISHTFYSALGIPALYPRARPCAPGSPA
jgi:GNAT superfamily N-acetyltransferase